MSAFSWVYPQGGLKRRNLYELVPEVKYGFRARICGRLWSPGIDSEESTPPGYVAWRAGTKNRVAVPARQAGNRFLGSLKDLQIPSLISCVQLYSLAETPQLPPSPRIWAHIRGRYWSAKIDDISL